MTKKENPQPPTKPQPHKQRDTTIIRSEVRPNGVVRHYCKGLGGVVIAPVEPEAKGSDESESGQ